MGVDVYIEWTCCTDYSKMKNAGVLPAPLSVKRELMDPLRCQSPVIKPPEICGNGYLLIH